ncbi:MAG: ATP-dependent Clp protease proteolytic subunit, partial [Rectinemataceae bacterium]
MRANKPWFSMAGNTISIYDEIDTDSVRAFMDELSRLPKSGPVKMEINSPGGDVFAGMQCYYQLAKIRDRLEIEVAGLAASISSIIALAGRKLTMAAGSFYMLHEPSAVMGGTA